MKTIEKLWEEIFLEECATIDTKEEKELVKEAAENHKTVNDLLTKEQSDAVEKYVDTLFQIQSSFVKKAFLKGVRFATSFLIEAGIL